MNSDSAEIVRSVRNDIQQTQVRSLLLKGPGILKKQISFESTLYRLYHIYFSLSFSKWNCRFDDQLLNFVKKQMRNSFFVRWQRYRWISKSTFIVDSPIHKSFAEQNRHVRAMIWIIETRWPRLLWPRLLWPRLIYRGLAASHSTD